MDVIPGTAKYPNMLRRLRPESTVLPNQLARGGKFAPAVANVKEMARVVGSALPPLPALQIRKQVPEWHNRH
jgi:hypothetical protein